MEVSSSLIKFERDSELFMVIESDIKAVVGHKR